MYAVGCDRGTHYYAMQLINGQPLSNGAFADFKNRQTILEFELRTTDKGVQAVNVNEFNWDD